MLKYICLLCGLLFIVSACGSKSSSMAEEDAGAALKQALMNYDNACANIALAQTKAKIVEADALKAEGKNSEARRAIDEAVELFKTEEPAYKSLNDANEAQLARAQEIVSRMEAMKADGMTAAPQMWNEAEMNVVAHLDNAQAAYKNCDVNAVAAELDAASMILDQMEQIIANTVVVTETQMAVMEGKVYTVKKGDCLWNIAGREYSNPFMWPIIYWANQNSINDPDLIFPGQNFDIIFDFAEMDQMKAEDFAKNRGPWSLYDNK